MNYNYNEAEHCRELIRQKFNCIYLTPFDFCDYMDIDEMLIQVFLASLKSDEALAPISTRMFVLATPEDTSDKPLRMLDDVKTDLQNGIMESFETIEERLRI